MTNSAYITTPIYYVNDKPHIGHAYTTTLCDVWARAMRFAGRDVFFLTGTDEHGVKVEKSAMARGISPQQLADENSAEFRRVLALFGLSNDHFIRTTDPDHKRQVQAFIKRLLEKGHIYLGTFEGWYDEGQEEYHTETRAKELDYKSPISGRPLTRAKEDNYYFRLSAFQAQLEKLFAERPDFVRPEGRRNEVLGRLRDGLQDVPVTRTNFTWGIPMPDAPGHVIYVWIDALLNYITALGLADEKSPRAKYWPATYHVVGKEILWFHAVIWPAMLMALDLKLPECVYAHSFWISEGQKMSKTLGNFIDLPTIERYHATYSLDAWRWYMITQGPLEATDADFSAKHFHEMYTAELVNTFANCASRTSAMIGKYFEGALPADGGGEVTNRNWSAICHEHVRQTILHYERFELRQAAMTALALVREVDAFINETQPFKLAKDPANVQTLGTILYRCSEALRIASCLLWPIMPSKVEEFWRCYGVTCNPTKDRLADLATWGHLKPGTRIEKCALFMRVEAPAATPTKG
ncbi:MAG: methionine--tRNA ligase [Phycisphaerae bacterium]|nr:methionine--tRNA ligase [Phycisphaerae bacterium]